MKKLRLALLASFTCAAIAPGENAVAQVPPHTPGSICVTPQFWCWVNPPGQPGAPCACPSPYGMVPGTLN